MNNVLLGKTIKAMYKLSGKTLTQLADETDLTIDTINNLFYARIQKPGFAGVNALVKASGFKISNFTEFLEMAEDLPEDTDITEAFTNYMTSAEDTVSSVKDTVPRTVSDTKTSGRNASGDSPAIFSKELEALGNAYEKQIAELRTTHFQYVDSLRTQHKEQIEEMKSSAASLKAHYDHSVVEIKKTHAEEMARQDETIRQLKRTNLILFVALLAGLITLIVIAFIIK